MFKNIRANFGQYTAATKQWITGTLFPAVVRHCKWLFLFLIFKVIPKITKWIVATSVAIGKFLLPHFGTLLKFSVDCVTGKYGVTTALFSGGVLLLLGGYYINNQLIAAAGVLMIIGSMMKFVKGLSEK